MILEKRSPGETIKAIRTKKGISQKDIAQAVGSSVASVCRWERGERQLTVLKFEEILDFLNAEYTVRY